MNNKVYEMRDNFNFIKIEMLVGVDYCSPRLNIYHPTPLTSLILTLHSSPVLDFLFPNFPCSKT